MWGLRIIVCWSSQEKNKVCSQQGFDMLILLPRAQTYLMLYGYENRAGPSKETFVEWNVEAGKGSISRTPKQLFPIFLSKWGEANTSA